ncbi:protein trichome birefringence-like 19 [Henckelia pumila]|uniref:protein trichome birefringence-like 19 n=1 Tax=Henckelia pumila TaxID=405737 RepID=UPI003C6DF33E
MELHLIKKPSAYFYNINIITIFITIIIMMILLFASSTSTYKRSAEIVDAALTNAAEDIQTKSDTSENCDIFSGEWVPDPNAPYYTNTTCWAIYETQDCLKNGRPDLGFLKWRWRPDGCELSPFDPFLFLNLVRDRTMAFIGDSLSRNHLQSMMCLLSGSVNPVDVSKPDNPYSSWKYESYNFTVVNLRSPFLVRFDEPAAANTGIFQLYLDELDESWTSQIDDFDYIILSFGHWYSRSAVYHQKRRVVGCHGCHDPNITRTPPTHSLGVALRAAFEAINSRRSFHGTTFLRTFSPSHFEGEWREGADCPRRRPFTRNETALEGFFLDVYETQLKEYFRVVERGKMNKFRLLDLTRAMLMRPDGHPSRYGHGPDKRTAGTINDCLHWCLPGPIDSWSDFLLHMIKMEQRDKLFSVNKKMMLNKSNNY